MKVAIATVQVPFIRGGAENLADGLINAIRDHGHEAELITTPFRFGPAEQVLRTMDIWATEDFNKLDIGKIDKVICLKFPTYYLRHPHKVAWLLHQHRSVYELYGTPYGVSETDETYIHLRNNIIARDTEAIRDIRDVYTIAGRVSERLLKYNGLKSKPLYHPPEHADRFYCAEQRPYIFFPSRLEKLKRQELLIRALAHVRSPVCVIIAGGGGEQHNLQALIEALGLQSRVRLIGRISSEEMLCWYANSLGIFFGPYDEDYGYITLEAMLSAKPVITCTDSGGPMEFVINNETGYIVEPNAEAVGNAIEQLFMNRNRAAEMGRNGLARYSSLDISWDQVVSTLLKQD